MDAPSKPAAPAARVWACGVAAFLAVIAVALAVRPIVKLIAPNNDIAGMVAWMLLSLLAPIVKYIAKSRPHLFGAAADPRVGTCALTAWFVSLFIMWPGVVLSSPGALIPFAAMVPAAGIAIMVSSLRHRRVGDSLHCPKCDYELGCAPEDAPIRCPECGHPWLGSWLKGASRRDPRRALLGAGIIVVGCFPMLLTFTSLGTAAVGVLPTRGLIALTAYDAWGHHKAAWSELLSRQLSSDERDALAVNLLDLRLSDGYLYGTPASWLDDAATRRTIPQPLIDRYYTEWFVPRLEAPAVVRRGTTPQVRLFAADHKGGPGLYMYVRVESASVDGQPLDPAKVQNGGWTFSLTFSQNAQSDPVIPRFVVAVDTSVLGEHHLAARLLTCVMPSSMSPPDELLYGSNGHAIAPPGAIYFGHADVAATIRVVE